MKYRLLGRSGMKVSELCLGTMTFGEEWKFGASEKESRAIFDAYSEAGGNFIDGANIYTNGTSERLIGEFIAQDRSRFILSTKYGLSTDHQNVHAGGNHRKSLCHAVEDSLKRMKVDYIDILWVHAWDGLTPAEEMLRALDDLVRSGKILCVGASNMPAWLVAQGQMLADLRGWARFAGLQVEYSLIERSSEHESLPMAAACGLSVLGWAPLAGGVLSGKYKLQGTEVHIDDSSRGSWLNKDRIDHRTMEIAMEVAAIAEDMECTPSQVALAWIRQNGCGVIPIIGARTQEQCRDNLAALDILLEDSQMQRLDAVSACEPLFPQKFLATKPLRRALFGDYEHALKVADENEGSASGGQAEIHAIATITAKPGHQQALAAAFHGMLDRVRNKTGCLQYDLATQAEDISIGAKPADEKDVILIERWNNRQALNAHLADPAYRDWFNSVRPLIDSASMQVLQKKKSA